MVSIPQPFEGSCSGKGSGSKKRCDSVICGCEICVEKSGEFSVPLKTTLLALPFAIFWQVRTTVHQGSLEIHIFPWVRVSFLATKLGAWSPWESKGPNSQPPPMPPPPRFCWILSHHCPLIRHIRPAIWGGWARLIPMKWRCCPEGGER